MWINQGRHFRNQLKMCLISFNFLLSLWELKDDKR